MNAFITDFNSNFGNKTVLRGNTSKSGVEIHMKSCCLLYQNTKVADRIVPTSNSLFPAVVLS